MAKAKYTVTDKGGARPEVAGRRRSPGEEISLTPAEAEWELGRGLIEASSEKSRKSTAKAEG